MIKRQYETKSGTIVYWVNELVLSQAKTGNQKTTLIFLPGLTADHRLFDKQIEYFENIYLCFVWDAPGHASSRPFTLDFTLEDKARWLHEILATEGITRPILVGQSMGGYVSQMYMDLSQMNQLVLFVSIRRHSSDTI